MEIKFLELTKKECIEGGVQTALNDIEGASTNMLDAYMNAKAHIEYLIAYTNTIKDAAMDEFDTYGEKEIEKYGRKITKFESGTKYDFSNCNYPGYESLICSDVRDLSDINDSFPG